jgi:hypothetical protein
MEIRNNSLFWPPKVSLGEVVKVVVKRREVSSQSVVKLDKTEAKCL